MRLYSKIALVILMFSAFIVLFFAIFLYNQVRTDQLSEYENMTQSQLVQLEQSIDILLSGLLNNTVLLTQLPLFQRIHPEMHSMLRDGLPAHSIPEYTDPVDQELIRFFQLYHNAHPEVTMVALGTCYGGYVEYPMVPLGQGYDPRSRPWYHEALKSPGTVAFTDPYMTLFSQTPQIGSVRTILDPNQEVLGVLNVSMSLEALWGFVESIQIIPQGRLIILDRNERIIIDSENPDLVFEPVQTSFPELMMKNLQTSFFPLRPNGSDHYISYLSSKNPDFYFVIMVPSAELFRSLNARTLSLIYLAALVFAIILIVIGFVSKFISKPFERFSQLMIQFGKGDYSTRCTLSGSKEIQSMSRNFNLMADTVEAYIEEKELLNKELIETNLAFQETNQLLMNSSQAIQEYSSNMEELITITSRICESALKRDREFLKDLLEMLLTLIDKADYGSISIVDGEDWKFVWSVGHDMEILRTLDLKKQHLIQGDTGAVIIDVMAENESIIPEDLLNQMQKATLPIKSSILSALVFHKRVLGSLSLDIAQESDQEFTENEVKIVNAFSNIASAFITMQSYMKEQEQFQKDLITALINLLEIHDPYTKGHSINVANYAVKIAEEMGLEEETISSIFWAGMVHDVGKILVPATILVKPSALTEDEFDLIQNHPIWGANVLGIFDALEDVSLYVRHHHERWDGKGYPDQLEKEAIPLPSRILNLADAFDAMTSERPYRNPFSSSEAYEEVLRCSGTQFDPKIVEAFRKIFPV